MKRILFIFAACLLFASCQNYSSGERVGVITKFSSRGAIWKSWEGELKVAPGLASGQTQMTGQYETFTFSFDNDKTIECETPADSVNQFVKEGIPVVIEYQQTRFLNWFQNRGETDHFVKSIKRIR